MPGIASGREHRLAAAVGHRDPLRGRSRRRRGRRDLRVRPPAGGPHAPRSCPRAPCPRGWRPAAIDAAVRARIAAGEDLYHLDRGALADLDADLVVTQDLCAVCAVDVSEVTARSRTSAARAEVLTIDPHDLERGARLRSCRLGAATGHEAEAAGPGRRPAGTPGRRGRAGGRPGPAADGGAGVDRPAVRPRPLGARDGAARRRRACWAARASGPCRVTWADVAAAARTSSSRHRAVSAWRTRPGWPRSCSRPGVLPDGVPVWAVDANASFARPGPRLVDGIEALAAILHGDQEPDPVLARRLR